MPNTNMSGNQGNAGNEEPFVESFEKAVMQYVILTKAQQGEVTRENLQGMFKGNLQMRHPHFESCLSTLVQTGHLKENGNKYTITDDGREDVQEVQKLVVELPTLANQGGQRQTTQGSQTNQGSQPRQGMGQQSATTGRMGGSSTPGGNTSQSSGNTSSSQQGNTGGNRNSNPGQSKGGQGGQGGY